MLLRDLVKYTVVREIPGLWEAMNDQDFQEHWWLDRFIVPSMAKLEAISTDLKL